MNDDTNEEVVVYKRATIDRVKELVTELEDQIKIARADRQNAQDEMDRLRTQLADVQAELSALRPLAKHGERALKENWHLANVAMLCCHRWYGDGHAETCEVPVLFARLEKKP